MFRTIYIKKSSKIKSIQGYLVIFDGDDEKKVFLDEINQIIFENRNSLITIPTLIELSKKNISVIFCDEKHNPYSTLLGLNSHYESSGNLYIQLDWSHNTKQYVWQEIVKSKILNQILVLNLLNKNNTEILLNYLKEIKGFDESNREGLAAKVYFFQLFGFDFKRERKNTDSLINNLLNYGYSMLLSCFNREIIASGYITQLGIFHKGKQNFFNLSCDFMEPFRPIVDLIVYLNQNSLNPLKEIRKLFSYKIIINNEERYIDDAIRIYVMCLLRMLKTEINKFPTFKFDLNNFKNDKSNANNSNV